MSDTADSSRRDTSSAAVGDGLTRRKESMTFEQKIVGFAISLLTVLLAVLGGFLSRGLGLLLAAVCLKIATSDDLKWPQRCFYASHGDKTARDVSEERDKPAPRLAAIGALEWQLSVPGKLAELFAFIEDPSEMRTQHRCEFIMQGLMPRFRRGENAVLRDAHKLVQVAARFFACDMTIGAVAVPEGGHVTVVGNVRGQWDDIETIFRRQGFPGPTNQYIFNGGIVSGEPGSIRSFLLVLALKITFPAAVFVNRGCFELRACSDANFGRVCRRVDSQCGETDAFSKSCRRLFPRIPVAHVIGNRVLVVHGGISRGLLVRSMHAIDRVKPSRNAKKALRALVENVPVHECDMYAERVQNEHEFTAADTQQFLQWNGLDMLVCSKQACPRGWNECHDARCVTIVSATRREGASKSAIMVFDAHLVPDIVSF